MNNDLILILECIKINRPIARKLCNIYLHSPYTNKSCMNVDCHNCLLTASVIPDIYVNSLIRIKIEGDYESRT